MNPSDSDYNYDRVDISYPFARLLKHPGNCGLVELRNLNLMMLDNTDIPDNLVFRQGFSCSFIEVGCIPSKLFVAMLKNARELKWVSVDLRKLKEKDIPDLSHIESLSLEDCSKVPTKLIRVALETCKGTLVFEGCRFK